MRVPFGDRVDRWRRGQRTPIRGLNWLGLLEKGLLVLLALLLVRLIWAVVTPVGSFGPWEGRQAQILSPSARQALFASFDPFFRADAPQKTGGVVTSLALVSMMFLIMVRVSDPLLPRAIFGLLNTLLYFPSGAVYPQQAFPGWMKVIAAVDPFTYAVHAFKSLLLKNTGFGAITFDLGYLVVFTIVTMTSATLLFKRTL